MFTVKILNSCFLGSMVYMYVVHWMLDDFIDYYGNHGNDNDDDNDESHDDS